MVIKIRKQHNSFTPLDLDEKRQRTVNALKRRVNDQNDQHPLWDLQEIRQELERSYFVPKRKRVTMPNYQDSPAQNRDEECPVCMVNKTIITLPNCTHMLCNTCLKTLLKTAGKRHCPMCRAGL